ncbi:MAG TPA: hypothetical protein VL475_04730 [Planctomycetaceae bacterium]|nr:hypothetical protein [Planctomycetaceae bacterium]
MRSRFPPVRGNRHYCLILSITALLPFSTGCDASIHSDGATQTSDGKPVDPFTAAAQDAEAGERPYIEASRPILTAVAARDYGMLYGLLSSHALAKVNTQQFGPGNSDPGQPQSPPTVLQNLSQEQFAEWMKTMEKRLGVPESVDHLSVQSIDPRVLSGKGEALDVMFAIGGMPPEIPAEIRKASIRAAIQCRLRDELVRQIATDLKITEDQVRSGKWPENDQGYDPDERPYLNLKFVLVEEDGRLKVGYFEFMPPSMLD